MDASYRSTLVRLVPSLAGGLLLLAASAAHADLPADYKGRPFDPKVAGGPKMPPTVKGGPYEIPGRLDFVNYDLGGEGISFHTGDHIVKGGTGYRVDGTTATFSLTTACEPTCPNVWYDTSATLDGTVYPSTTTGDFSIGAVQDGDWMDFTVNVKTTGTYTASSTWATGNGPPGGEGGNGTVALSIYQNGVKVGGWTAVFPNYNTTADFRHWKAYPSFATVQLTAGMQLIQLKSNAKHLQMDYVQFDLVGADGGVPAGDGGSAGATGAGGSTGATGAAGTTAAGGTSGGAAGTGAAGDAAGSGSAGTTVAGGAGTGGGAAGTGGGTTTGAGGTGTKGAAKSGGCSVAPGGAGDASACLGVTLAMTLALGGARRRRTRR